MFAKTLTQVRAAITSWKLPNPTRNRLAAAYFFTRTSKVNSGPLVCKQTSYRITIYSIRLWVARLRACRRKLQALNLSEWASLLQVGNYSDGKSGTVIARDQEVDEIKCSLPTRWKRTNWWIKRFKNRLKRIPWMRLNLITWAKFRGEPNHTWNNIETSYNSRNLTCKIDS